MKKLVKIGFSCILGVLASVSAVGSAPPISPQEKRQDSMRLFQAEVSCELSKLAAETLASTNSISFADRIYGLQNIIESSIPRSCLPIYLYYCIEPSHWVSCDDSAQDESVHNQFCPMFCIGLKDVFGSSLHSGGNGIVSLSSSDFSTNSLSIDGFSRLFIHEITNVVEVKFESAHTVQPDICVVLVDSLRVDHLGCYGYERDTSPAVDAFAAGAVRFDQAIASGSWTQPSIMSMMTSVPADVHQRVHWGRPHSTNVVTLAETLQKAGYQTVGLVANPMTNRKYGFARGFDFYDDYSLTGAPDATTGDIARQTAQGAKLTRLARDWIERRRDPEKPLFLFVLYIDVHWDYLPPPPFNRMFAPDPVPPPRDIWNLGRASVPEAARRRSVAAYDGEIRYTDGCISNLLAAIDASPRGKDTIVVFCSDHGESFWERGVASHGNALFDEELRVPLVIRPARGDGDPAPGRVASEQVGLIDLAPTLADLAGVPAPTNWVGRSLAPALRGETLPEVPVVLDNRIGDDGAILRGVRTSRWKVLAGPPHDRPTSLYDLLADPAETNDLLRAGIPLPPEVEALVPLLRPSR